MTFFPSATTVFADGPTSDPYQPDKAQVRALLTSYEDVMNAFTTAGGLIYSTLAELNSDLAHAAYSMAWVIGDPVAANNGIYLARDTGWVPIASLGGSVFDSLTAQGGVFHTGAFNDSRYRQT